ncbi:MAG: FecR domain-containing protein [Alphaproteobacteria bacterium]|nr:FecR domain-containing protein [Alphaproteobacteria bacterium]
MPRIVSMTLVAMGCVLFAASPGLAAPAGEVLAIKGDCVAASGGKRAPLKLGDPVQVGDTVEVAEGARLKLRMVDGSVISAASGTQVTIEAYEGQPRDAKLALASGLLRAVVAKAAQPSRFEVGTATGVAAVRSTDWFVIAEAKGTQVGVLDGTVSLSSTATQRAVNIPARWGARVEPGRDPVPARVWSQAEFDAVIARTNAE